MKKIVERNGAEFGSSANGWRESRVQGAVLSLVSAASVVLSVLILFGYATSLADRMDRMELGAQAYLAHHGSIDHAVAALTAHDAAYPPELQPISTAGMLSTFQLSIETQPGSCSMDIRLDGAEDIRVAVCGSGVIAAGTTPEGILVTFHRTGSDHPEPGFPVTVGHSRPAQWAIAGVPDPGARLGLLAFSQGGSDSVCLVGENGSLTGAFPVSVEVTDESMITFGSHSGKVSAVVTDGTNRGELLRLDDLGSSQGSMVSTGGTCPCFLPWGALYGDLDGSSGAIEDGLPVTDMFTGDFDQDGSPDVAWAGPSSLACSLSGSGRILLDVQPGDALTAWGFLEGRYGLGGLWESPDGRLSWRKLLWSGFQQLPAASVALDGYSGRIWASGGEIAGVKGEDLSYSRGVSTEPVLLVPGGIPLDLDGSGIVDALVTGNGLVTLMPDPTGTGVCIVRLTVTTFSPSGEVLLTDTRTVLTTGRPGEAGA